ncbi:MAG: hypothetical protein PHU06_06330 [Gallionella sp.]|nr:hypothetical protein [Gallionella sp.]MDD4958417.1 hypothetical protein [Gallionella sp.]
MTDDERLAAVVAERDRWEHDYWQSYAACERLAAAASDRSEVDEKRAALHAEDLSKITAERDAAIAERDALKLVSALALNKLCGQTVFDKDFKPEELKKVAIERGLFVFDNFHHAPMCPANHFHQQRIPTGECSCGAAHAALNPEAKP